MAPVSPLPAAAASEIMLVRPLLDIPKTRLVATLTRAGIAFADDASNRDPRFTRARLRAVMPALAREGLDARRLALLARRLRRAEAAIETAVARCGGGAVAGAVVRSRSDRLRCRKIHPLARGSRIAAARACDRAARRRGAGAARQARGALRGAGERRGGLAARNLPAAAHVGGSAGDARRRPARGRARAGADNRLLDSGP